MGSVLVLAMLRLESSAVPATYLASYVRSLTVANVSCCIIQWCRKSSDWATFIIYWAAHMRGPETACFLHGTSQVSCTQAPTNATGDVDDLRTIAVAGAPHVQLCTVRSKVKHVLYEGMYVTLNIRVNLQLFFLNDDLVDLQQDLPYVSWSPNS